jgi:anaerobic selenocysteine-containing dehydrogenase
VYSPDRVLHPVRRTAPKGQGKGNASDFTQISWDEALDEISGRFKKISDEFGPEAILPYSYAGNMGVLSYSGMAHRFFHRLGASQLDRTICASAGGAGMLTVTGRNVGTEPQQFDSKYIIAWGANIHATNVHLWPLIAEARRNGARVGGDRSLFDARGQERDWYLPINPGLTWRWRRDDERNHQ